MMMKGYVADRVLGVLGLVLCANLADDKVDRPRSGNGQPTEHLKSQFTEDDLAQFEIDITMLDDMSQTNTDSHGSSTNTDHPSLVESARKTTLEYSNMHTATSLLFNHEQGHDMEMVMWPSLSGAPISGTVSHRLDDPNLSLDFSRALADEPDFADEKDIMSCQSFHSTYFPKLSELGLKIFLSSKRYQSNVAANQDQTTYTSQVEEDMVNLSRE
ncbi:hypothetical protein OPT61_g8400 [Boeremia exigua]|uniref:Uncharacterized protein n=1 Tax=Boeremia exigua TaxID=749465 RepID=A0ACC2HZ05_9PLEO|nr:hypothetical protein OPT61_g8400 [Boeremia exigua]